ncbi:MAG: FAD-binding oxidoreductase [Planctomycetes bacterium]|nr:FAD-binding oxidoreductase [Planctomycetota bacterium]
MSSALARLPHELDARVAGVARPHPSAPELPLVIPRNVDELVECLRAATREKLALVPCGLATKLAWTRAPERADCLLSTRALDAIVAHEPDDGTLVAQSGIALATLRARARAGGHWCTPDLPRPETSTLGGALALGRSGADRTRHAPLRNHVLGMTVALADGTLAKSGGRLVKNVTGYDLQRLYTGSHGTLAVIVDAALRLFPAPESEAWLVRDVADATEALRVARAASELTTRWLTLSIERRRERWSVLGRLAGKAPVVEHELALARPVLGAPAARDADAAKLADEVRDASPSTAANFARIGCRPSRLAEALGIVGESLVDARIEPTIASIEFTTSRSTAQLAALRPALAKLAASLHLVSPEAGVETFDALGGSSSVARADAPSAELALMRRLKAQLDPHGVFACGRFVGGL